MLDARDLADGSGLQRGRHDTSRGGTAHAGLGQSVAGRLPLGLRRRWGLAAVDLDLHGHERRPEGDVQGIAILVAVAAALDFTEVLTSRRNP